MATRAQICSLLPPPDRTDVLRAISKTIGLIRRKRLLKAPEIAKVLTQQDGNSPDAETIRRAERGDTLLSFDLIAQIAFLYPECSDPLRAVMEPSAEITTLEDRLQRVEQELLIVRREIASREGDK